MKKSLTSIILSVFLALALTGCVEEAKSTNKSVQAQRAKEAANSISFTENAEIDNIKRRLEQTSKPDALGFIVLLNETGQPVMYTSVKGKITSGGKRLTEPDRVGGYADHPYIRQAPSDEGTYGHSGEYIFFWNADGQYIQWNGKYLFSDKPFRLKTEPLVVSVKE